VRLFARYARLGWLDALRRTRVRLGTAPVHPLAVERHGRLPGVMWEWVAYPPPEARRPPGRNEPPRSHEVRMVLTARPDLGVHTRWVWGEGDAVAWLVLATRSPHWLVLTEDGDSPWSLLRGVGLEEVASVLHELGCDDKVTRAVARRMGE
jgi:hypothetical protein